MGFIESLAWCFYISILVLANIGLVLAWLTAVKKSSVKKSKLHREPKVYTVLSAFFVPAPLLHSSPSLSNKIFFVCRLPSVMSTMT